MHKRQHLKGIWDNELKVKGGSENEIIFYKENQNWADISRKILSEDIAVNRPVVSG